MPLPAYFESIYVRVIYNFGFSGEDVAVPFEVAIRLLEFYLFFKDFDKSKITTLIMHMIEMKKEQMLHMESEELFGYLSKGEFITDIFMNEADFKFLFEEKLKDDLDKWVPSKAQ